MMDLLQTENLVKTYKGRTVVNRVSIRIGRGDGVLGPNGAGKTTCFYMVVGVIRPDSGKILFRGEDITKLPMHERARLGIGYLSQEPSIFRKLTVEENVMAILETLDIPQRERDLRLRRLLNELDIASLAKSKAYTLSGGERRRLEITRALVTNPSLLLLDEPFSGVDPIAVFEVQKNSRRLKAKASDSFDGSQRARNTRDHRPFLSALRR
jgi:lipopolysaccharide export system ATP-binding protein